VDADGVELGPIFAGLSRVSSVCDVWVEEGISVHGRAQLLSVGERVHGRSQASDLARDAIVHGSEGKRKAGMPKQLTARD